MDRPEERDKYRNWVKGALAYKYLKDGITEFADDVVQQEHTRILHTVINTPGLGCNQCSLSDLKPSHTFTEDPVTGIKTCLKGQKFCNCLSTKAKPCPYGICDAIMEKIFETHGSKPPRPNWGNTEARKWCSNPWEIAKCFVSSPGYFHKSEADEFDDAALLQMFINNVSYKGHLSEKLSRSDILKKILQRRNEIFHSSTMGIELSELEECLDEIIVFLEDEKELKARKEAQEAVCKLKELKQESFVIARHEVDVIQAAMKHILKTLDDMTQLIKDLTEKVDKSFQLMTTTIAGKMHTKPTNHKDQLNIMRQNYQEQLQCVEQNQDNLWMSFIAGDIKTDLLAEGILPRNELLQIACTKFGRDSNIVCKICSKISEFIKMSTNDIVDTWAAYQYPEHDKKDETSVVFVVFTTQKRAQIVVKDYIIQQREINTYSSESQDVLVESRKALDNDLQTDEIIELKKCIEAHSDALMDSHSNLNIISPSLKRSRSYGTDSCAISDELCIVLYVDVKGFIPIQEEPFPKQLGGFPTDVWEGGFESFGGRPNDTHEHMKMGLAIHANCTNDRGELIGGTLSGFVEHESHGLCGITCSHVLLSGEEMIAVVQNGGQLDIQKLVYHPIDPSTSTPFGNVVSAVIKDGSSTAGVDVAMFKVKDKFPLKGDFPEAFNYLEAGFDDEHPLLFNSGDVLDVSVKLKGRPEVYKFGITTGITRGSFGLQGTVIRRKKLLEGQWDSFGYRLKNLIEILAVGGEPFALPGDSGALVMIEGAVGDSVAIGIVQAGLLPHGGRVFVSPICSVLKSLGCPSTMKKFYPNATNSQITYQRTPTHEQMETE